MRNIPMSSPDISDDDIRVVVEVLNSKQLSMGPFLERFEQAFADYIGTRYAIGVSSGTAGLHLSICAGGIGPGDEVITTSFSFVASANCILYERATPVFVDIDETSLNIDPGLVAAAVTERSRAVLPVHVFGRPCEMDQLEKICRDRHLMMIEDACEALGATYRNRRIGSFGKAAIFGFYPNKQMTTGEGGIITTDDADWAAQCRNLRNQGRGEMNEWLRHFRLGFNYRLNEMSAALGFSQLSRIERLLAARDRVASAYEEMLREVPGVMLLSPMHANARPSRFVFVVRLDETISRDLVIADLRGKGIPTRTYFSPIHLQPFFMEQFGYREGDLPVTERVASSTLALPFHTNMPLADIEYVVQALKESVARRAN
jgi:dTDP-4-amino-4,6-dideoxygalactose transaminase